VKHCSPISVRVAETIRFDIYIAGDVETARAICRKYCFDVSLCVTVEPVAFVYKGGEESGVRIGLINYPRFPKSKEGLRSQAIELADLLMSGLYQMSYSVVGPDQTEWFSRRPEDLKDVLVDDDSSVGVERLRAT
jgi:hypothetical protein